MRRYACLLDDAPVPRLCRVKKWSGYDGYGFNLQGMSGEPGHFIGQVVAASSADYAGLREGDRLIEVNGLNVECLDHALVIEAIRADPRVADLLVADAYTCNYYRSRNLVIDMKLPNVRQHETPDLPPREGPMKPRICLLKKWSDFIGFGFTIQSDMNRKNPVVAQVDPESPAEHGGLKVGDKVVEVNDVPTYIRKGEAGDKEDKEIPYEQLLSLIRSNPERLKLLVIEESNYQKFVNLLSKGSYNDDQIETIECPDDNPKTNKQITFSIESPTDSIGRGSAGTSNVCHSTPKAQSSRPEEGTQNGAFVSDAGDISPVGAKRDAPVMEKPGKEKLSENGLTKDDFTQNEGEEKKNESVVDPEISLKYCVIPSEKGPLCFGFNVVAEKPKPGNYFENVEKESPAHRAGVSDGDYLVAVNGSLAYRDNHQQVVEKIKRAPKIVRIVCTDKSGFERFHALAEREVEEMVEQILGFKISDMLSVTSPTDSRRKFKLEAENVSNSQTKPEDDSFSIDYKQVADDMVELALNEAKQDNIKLGSRSRDGTLTKSSQMLQSLSTQSLEVASTSSFVQDYSSLPSSTAKPPTGSRSVTVGGLQFAATAAEARRNMKKRSDFKNTGMTLAEKYKLLKGL